MVFIKTKDGDVRACVEQITAAEKWGESQVRIHFLTGTHRTVIVLQGRIE